MAYNNPGITEFKDYFVRDFPYTTDPSTGILDADISKALFDADSFANQELFSDQLKWDVGFLNLAAHFMVLSINASSQGINGQFAWLVQSHAVGSVSESLSIPQRILENPEFAWLSKTNYGTKYLMLILPQLTGQIFVVEGSTRP